MMGKGDRRKKKPLDLPDLPPVKQQPRRGRPTQAVVRTERDPQRTALSARCRQAGEDDTEDNRRLLSAQHCGEDLGRVIDHDLRNRRDQAKERQRLWGTWTGYCTAHAAYSRIVLGMSEHAKGASIQMVRERMEADQSHTVDTRSPEERADDAKRARARWDGHIAALPGWCAGVLALARTGGGMPLWRDGKPTKAGDTALTALKALAKQVEG